MPSFIRRFRSQSKTAPSRPIPVVASPHINFSTDESGRAESSVAYEAFEKLCTGPAAIACIEDTGRLAVDVILDQDCPAKEITSILNFRWNFNSKAQQLSFLHVLSDSYRYFADVSSEQEPIESHFRIVFCNVRGKEGSPFEILENGGGILDFTVLVSPALGPRRDATQVFRSKHPQFD